MLAIRDIDLFEGMTARLPWKHRPMEVIKELLGLSTDVQARDHNGCSALHYATLINSSLADEIIYILVETLGHTDAVPVSPLVFEKRSCRDLDSEFGDSDIELDIESLYPNESSVGSPTPTPTHQHRFLLYRQAEEVLEAPGCPPLSDHHKDLSQDKGISPCFQKAMETLRDIRQAYQDAGRGSSSRGLSLPTLNNNNNNSKHWGHGDPAPSPGMLSTRTPCQPVPPTHRPRTSSMVTASPPSHCLLSVVEPSQLSQSAPSIMEPLLCSNTMMQARAHIQTRLGTHNTMNEQQGLLLARHSRTPKLLAPLRFTPRDITALPALKQCVPLKPISRSPLCSRAKLRRERLSWGSPCSGPLSSKAGSEESGPSSSSSSSSSRSSLDLEDEDDVHERAYEDRNLKLFGGRLLRQSKDASSTEDDLHEEQSRTHHVPLIHKSAHNLKGDSIKHRHDLLITEKVMNCEATCTKEYGERPQKSTTEVDTVNYEVPITSESKEKINVGCTTELEFSHSLSFYVDNDQGLACSGGNYRNEQQHVKKDSCDPGTQAHKSIHSSSAVGQNHLDDDFAAINLSLSKRDQQIFKGLNLAPIKDKNPSTNNQTNQSFNTLNHKQESPYNLSKSKSNTKSSLFKQVKDKSPELAVSREATVTKLKSKTKSVKVSHCNVSTSSPHRKVSDHLQSKRVNPDWPSTSRTQQHAPARELKSAQQSKKSCLGGKATRSKSAVDLISYKDMFEQTESKDKGPAIYELFAGPIYENLRVSSSCEKERQVQCAPPKKTQQSHKVKHRPLKPAQSKLRRSPGETTVVPAKSKAKTVVSKMKPTPLSQRGKTESVPNPGAEPVPVKDIWHNSARDGDDVLASIEEALSRSETLKPDEKTLISSLIEDALTPSTENRPVLSQGPHQPKINTWTSNSSSSSSCHTIMSPVYQKFLDEAGEGPLTDDLLQCLAEELISLDERDVSIDPLSDHLEQSKEEHSRESGQNVFPQAAYINSGSVLGSGLVVDNTISWTKGEVLGRGAYGTVYCGLTSQGQLIAVKQVSLDSSDPETAKKEYNQLQGEVELLKTLRHINIVGFLGTSLDQNVVSIFMEYIPGGSIASILHRFGPLPERVLALYTHQILEGVAFLHLNRVIHRDLKGNNVMLMPTGVIKLIDFGCARRLSCLNHTACNSGDLLKSVHGTPYWMAPEVINETGYGSKSDIWSVGCTVFEMATGKPPLAHMDKMAALFYIGAQRGLMPTLPKGFSDNAKDFVEICLTSDQRRRPSADQLLKHSFIPKNKTHAKIKCCSHPQGLCG
ncbi:uncharacterized protein map3k19 isoform X3 [Parambassis ranga]|uniref:Mitogen-activated protein kinase kinase kinase 19 n=1 Tax=Parambassis ranga TaxID=210632 RepID=A0A6P7HAW3_9TELE|nr:mitogen-activated protein kinase kinase kinase 19 isoform X3 [Parambassis ranga]